MRLWLNAVVCCALLAGCQSAPKGPPAATVEQQQALSALGFTETQDGWMLNVAVPILFDVGHDEVKLETRKALGDMAQTLRKVGIQQIRVEGHTDNLGSRDFNIDLSRRRADAVARELGRYGFADTEIERRAWAFDYPVASNDTPEGRARNRRVTIVVLPPGLAPE